MRTGRDELVIRETAAEADLEVRGLSIGLASDEGAMIVDRVSLSVARRSIVGVLGESGSGKTVMCLSVLGLLPAELRMLGGSIRFLGDEIAGPKSQERLRKLRGTGITMIFQQPGDCLNPIVPVGHQVARLYRVHHRYSAHDAKEQAASVLQHFGFRQPREIMKAYPHQLSGGMAQRVVLAAALACRPRLLIADEPTTGLDVTTASEALTLIQNTIVESGASAIVVTHDVGIAARISDYLLVMHAGHIVERGPTKAVLTSAAHPYTRGLLASVPTVKEKRDLLGIPGQVPEVGTYPKGCRFMDRCPFAMESCRELPREYPVGKDHFSLCWLHENSHAPTS